MSRVAGEIGAECRAAQRARSGGAVEAVYTLRMDRKVGTKTRAEPSRFSR